MIGRPQESEAAPYYFTYINQVKGDDVKDVLTRQTDDTRVFFESISEEASLRRYAPDKWSIRQVLNHVTDTERAFAFRALWFARGFDAPLPSYDQNVAAAGADADRVSWAEHVKEFRSVRLSTICIVQEFPGGGVGANWDREREAFQRTRDSVHYCWAPDAPR